MPTYEYACSSCANEWEYEQSIKDDPLKECPKCHAMTARRQISRGAGFILKGGGWYSDLYSSSSNKGPDNKGPDKPSTETKPSESTKSDSSSSSDTGSSSSSPKASTSAAA